MALTNTISLLILLLGLIFNPIAYAQSEQDDEDFSFDDAPVSNEIKYPQWFKNSFLDLSEDIEEAKQNNKKGIIVYFGQKHCAYCLALMKNDFGQEDIATYTKKYFDVVPINIWGSKEVTLPNGKVVTEKEFAIKEKADLTPSLVFYNSEGKRIFMLRGYYPPYKFRAALEYIAEEYYKQESFANYIRRADPPPKFEISDLNHEEFFMPEPYALSRKHFKADKPLLVFFEQRDCYACDVLHSESTHHEDTRKLLKYFDIVQIDINADTPVLTPDGQKLTAKQWAIQLGLFYTPTIIAFDESGNEILRIDSVAHIYRLQSFMEFIASKVYKTSPNFISWRFDVLFGGQKLPVLDKLNEDPMMNDE
ncbi:MAG: thioredoxin fold domain-containing protein [Gammaproteobacteria bacterium]|nr:thioredoxin fold domain-containing protein [Gammaproteobacteria bacterium]